MTIWNLLQRIGYNSSAYDGTSSAEMQPLDPILIATADMTKIRKAAQLFPTLWQFLRRIYEPEVFKALIDKALMRKVVWTNNCYHEHIQQLLFIGNIAVWKNFDWEGYHPLQFAL